MAFNIAAMFIMFRESLEACVIVAVMLQLLTKMNMPHLKKWVWWGALGGLILSIIFGAIFVLCINLLANDAVQGQAQQIFKGVIIWIACLLVTYVAFHFLKFYNVERKWRKKLEAGLSHEVEDEKKTHRKHKWEMIIMAGSATLREGMESVLFLTAAAQGEGVKQVILPALVGIAIGLIVGFIVFYTGRSIKSLKWFFIFSCGFLLLVAAGLVVIGTTLFTYAYLFGPLWPAEIRPWCNQVLWDVSACCNPNTNYGWQLMRTLFGWQDIVTNLMFLYYCLYWFMIVCMFAWKWYSGRLTDKKESELAAAKSMMDRQRIVSVDKISYDSGSEESKIEGSGGSNEASDIEASPMIEKAV